MMIDGSMMTRCDEYGIERTLVIILGTIVAHSPWLTQQHKFQGLLDTDEVQEFTVRKSKNLMGTVDRKYQHSISRQQRTSCQSPGVWRKYSGTMLSERGCLFIVVVLGVL